MLRKRTIPANSFLKKLEFYRSEVDLALQKELSQQRNSPFFNPFINAFTGGKRIRPIIVLLAYDCVGGQDADPLPAAVAVELAHMESLIHDDIIDGDGIRRNAEAFHVKYGQEMALLSADFTLSMILSIATRYSDPRIMNALAIATAHMCEGELMERFIGETHQAVHPDVYQNIVLKKTASLFEAAATMGAIIGGATPAESTALAMYAQAIGVAFQIHDDILDWAQSRKIGLVLKDASHSQNEYLQETASEYITKASSKLRQIKSSEAKQNLIELAESIDAGTINHV